MRRSANEGCAEAPTRSAAVNSDHDYDDVECCRMPRRQRCEMRRMIIEERSKTNARLSGWERKWRDRMPSSTRMWRAVSEQKIDRSPCSLRCCHAMRSGFTSCVTSERLFIHSRGARIYLAPGLPFGRPRGHAGARPRRGLLNLLRFTFLRNPPNHPPTPTMRLSFNF